MVSLCCQLCNTVFPNHLRQCPKCGWNKVPPPTPQPCSSAKSFGSPKDRPSVEGTTKALQEAGFSAISIGYVTRLFGLRDR
jgi:hypothetical protein